MIIETEQEYKDFAGINQSRLKLIQIPTLFVNKKETNEDDGEAEHFTFGTYVDELLYKTEEEIQDKYFVLNAGVKSPPEGPKKIIEDLIKATPGSMSPLDDYVDLIHRISIINQTYTTFKRETVFDKVNAYSDYYYSLRAVDGKIVITPQQKDVAIYYKNLFETDSRFKQFYYDSNTTEVKTKVRLGNDLKVNGVNISVKGELDRLLIDHENKTWRNVDDKTSFNPSEYFKTIVKYRYDFQAAFYSFLVSMNLKELGLEGYTQSKDHGVSYSTLVFMNSGFKNIPEVVNIPQIYGECSYYAPNGMYYMGYKEALLKYCDHRDREDFNSSHNMLINGFNKFELSDGKLSFERFENVKIEVL